MERLKAIIKPYDSERDHILNLSFKLILLLAIWSWKCNNELKKKITNLRTTITQVYWSVLNVFPWWISKPWIRKHKTHSKTSKGAGRFAHILFAFKKSQYNICNCKSGSYNRCHTFRHHNTQFKPSLTNIPSYGLKIEKKKNGKTKTWSPHQRNRMPHAYNLHQDTSNDHVSMNWGYDNHSCINLPYYQGINQVNSSINLQDEVILPKVVTRPTKKPRSVGSHKLIPKKSRNKKNSHLRIKKFRSIIKSLCEISAGHNNNNGLKPPQHLLYNGKDRNKYPFMDDSTPIPIVCLKITKKQSHIISGMSIFDQLKNLNSVTGLNLTLTHQSCQIRINSCDIVLFKDFYSYMKLLHQTYMTVYHT